MAGGAGGGRGKDNPPADGFLLKDCICSTELGLGRKKVFWEKLGLGSELWMKEDTEGLFNCCDAGPWNNC